MKKLALVIGMCLTINSCFAVGQVSVEKNVGNIAETSQKLTQSVEKMPYLI